ncbi:hypothetical protein LWI29_038172 [Acer saccharum]|uniref:Uncharacterized protein n=1 Tax=Acer saccharum TaxID=4024 RepID=A0AA39RF89_ACESA|nr:hypothetical protein LWI29_038172 [Acer saccharum]
MFSWVSLLIKKSSPFIPYRHPNHRLIIRTRSFFGGFGYDTLLNSSGVAVAAGSTLGFCYWFSDSNTNSFLSFADSPPKEKWEGDGTQLQHSIPPENNGMFLFGDSYRRRVFFNYEKRIRTQSPPEKVFEYFASYTTPSGDVLMTPTDFMRAIVPVFPPSESNRIREGYLKGEKGPSELQCAPSKFFMLFDTDNDGLISFSEYIFFVTLLSIPESSFSIAFKMFDLDNNGEIDKEEFKKVMGLMQTKNKQGARLRNGRRFGLKDSGEDGGLVEYFFGRDGNTCLKHEKFVQFLRDLHDEILQLEFSHYDIKSRGIISARDFALSLVAAADIGLTNKLLDRVDEVNDEPHLKDIRITFQEFKDFAELRKKLQSLSLAIFTYGKANGVLTKKDFQRATSQKNWEMQFKKELCRNFQRGSCQYGERCKFIHAKSNAFATNQQQNPNPFGFGVPSNSQPKGANKPFENKWSRFSPITTTEAPSSRKPENQPQPTNHKCTDPDYCKRLIVEDFEHERPLWKLTCYSHWKNAPCDIIGDVSYEELRAAAYDDAKRGLSLQSIVERERNLLNSKLVEFDNLLRNPYTGPYKSGVASQSSFPAATPNAFSPTPQNSAPPSVSSFSHLGSSINSGFGMGPSAPSNTAFGQPNLFPNSSQTSSATNNFPSANSGPFGNQFPAQATRNSFTSNTTSINNSGAFGAESNQFSTPAKTTHNASPFSFSNQSSVNPSRPVTSTNAAEQAPINIQLAKNLESGTVTGDASVWLKEKWIPGEIPEEAPPDVYVM